MKQFRKDAKNLMITGIGLGVGTQVMSASGANAAALTPMTSKLGTLGSISASGTIMRKLKKL